MKKISQSGRSMMEMLGVLAIIGVLSVGGFAMVSKMQANYEANKVIDEISDLANKIKAVFRDYENKLENGNIMNQYIRKAKAYPDSFNENESGTINNDSFLGSTGIEYDIRYVCSKVKEDTQECIGSEYYMIFLKNMTEDLCNQVVTSNWGSPSTNGFIGIGAHSEAALSCTDCSSCGRANSKDCPVPMGIGDAVDFCSKRHNLNLLFK